MSQTTPSRDWLKDLGALYAQLEKTPNASHGELAKALKLHRPDVSVLLALKPLFDPPTLEKVRKAASSEPSYKISFSSIKLLVGLRGNVPDYTQAGREALDQILAQRMLPGQITALVEKMTGGKSGKKPGSSTASGGAPFERMGKALDGWLGFGGRISDGSSQPFESLRAGSTALREPQGGVGSKTTTDSLQNPKPTAQPRAKGSKSLWLKPLKLAGEKIYGFFKWLVQLPFRLLSKGFTDLLQGKWARGIVQLGFAALVFWAILWAWNHKGRALGWGEGVAVNIYNTATGWVQPYPPAAQTPPKQGEVSKPPQTSTKASLPVADRRISPKASLPTANRELSTGVSLPTANRELQTGSHPWQSGEEDEDSIYAEINAFPSFFIVKPFAYIAGAAMTAEKALRYLGDLQNGDKYTVKSGPDTRKVLSAVPSSSGLSLAFQGSLGGLLGDNSKLEFYWEDVKAIHCDIICIFSKPEKVFYQCSLLVKDQKKPLTVQCRDAENLGRLASALDFQVQSANGGRAVPIGGMPYLYQGLVLDESNAVIGMWNQSPTDNLGLWLGDKVINLDSDNDGQQGWRDIEGNLQAAQPGKHVLLVDVPAEDSKTEEKKEFVMSVP